MKKGDIRLLHVSTLEQIANILTKYLPTNLFLKKFGEKVLHGVENHPEGECAKVYTMTTTVKPRFVEEYMGDVCCS